MVLGMGEIDRFLEQWEMDVPGVHRRLILAPTPRERERRHAVWPLALGSGLERLGHRRALRRDPHTIGRWLAAFGQGGPAALVFEQSGGSPLEEAQQAELKAAVQEPPAASGIGLTNWNWKAVRQFVLEHFGISLSRSSCLNCLHRLGFAFKRPKKRLLKADAEKREAFVSEYAALVEEAQGTGEKIFNADEAIWGWAREEARVTCAGEQSGGARESRQLPRRVDQPEGRGETPLPYHLAIKDRRTEAILPERLQAHL